MAFQSSVNFNYPPQTFAIRTPAIVNTINRLSLETSSHISSLSLGATGCPIPIGLVANNTIVVSPLSAGQVYVLPPAIQILSEFGEELGQAKIKTFDQIHLNVVNHGTFPATISTATTPDGGDLTTFTAFSPATGSLGSIQPLVIEFQQVNNGTPGPYGITSQATGVYSIYTTNIVGLTGPAGLSSNTGATGPSGSSITGPAGATGGSLAYGYFYGLTAGTDSGATEYAATIAAGAPINFGHSAATSGGIAINNPGTVTVQTNNTKFTLPNIGTYEVTFSVQTTEPGQFQADIGDGTTQVIVPGSCGVNQNPTSGGHPISQTFSVTTASTNRILRIINPAGNTPALTITPADGASTHANTPTLSIRQK